MFLEDIFKGFFVVTSQVLLYNYFKLYLTLLTKTFYVLMFDIIVFLITHYILIEISLVFLEYQH